MAETSWIQPPIRAVIDPAAPRRYRRWKSRRNMGSPLSITVVGGVSGGLAACALALVVAAFAPVGGLAIAGVATGALVAVGVRESKLDRAHLVAGTGKGRIDFQGRELRGTGLDLLKDITHRFDHAKTKIDELPGLVQWDDVDEAAEAIRFDAARHAAELSRTEEAWTDVRHAVAGSPQAALRARLELERADELAILQGYQRTADRLMNRAADAVAAATIAAQLGHDLSIALPSASADAARARLEVVIERLDALTQAWRVLDTSTDLLSEQLAAEEAQRGRAAAERAKLLTSQLDRAIGATPEGGEASEPGAGGTDPTPV